MVDKEKVREAVEKIGKSDVFHTTINQIHNEIVVLESIAELYIQGKLVEPASQGKMYETLVLINKIACQRFQYPRDSNEDNEGWLEIGNISAKALTGKLEKVKVPDSILEYLKLPDDEKIKVLKAVRNTRCTKCNYYKNDKICVNCADGNKFQGE